jgi:acetyl-CoA C-acetyltransferase
MKGIRDVVIVNYLRSPFSRSRPAEPKRDVFNKVRMDDVAAKLIREIVKRTGVNPEEINDVLTGVAMPLGEQWLYGGRHITYLAKLPVSVPAQQMDRQCASSMSAIHQGAMEIQLGYSDIVMAGGIEHMTHNPMPTPGMGDAMKRISIVPNPRLLGRDFKEYDLMTSWQMGQTAEKLCRERDFIREDLDRWACHSQNLAEKALNDGYFKDEIMPVEGATPDGKKQLIDHDMSIRPGTTMEGLSKLRSPFKKDGMCTAGNSSPLNAGATMMMLMSEEKTKEYGLEPMAKIISMGWAAVDPTLMGLGPIPASRMALEHAGMEVDDIDYWEINEAFAIVTINTIKELGIKDAEDKVNMRGGAIAIGHPLGATGARLVGTLARTLELEDARYGLATPCVGGGQGTATIIERI